MSDKKIITICVVVGLGLAYVFSGPLRNPHKEMVGTPIRPTSSSTTTSKLVYAEGEINLDLAAVKKDEVFKALFIVVKAVGMQGAPLAVKKVENPSFPLTFSLSDADSMFGSEFYDGDIVLSVKLDHDGVVGPKDPTDIETSIEIKKGSSRSVLVKLAR